MSITDELRDYVSHYSVVGSTKDKLLTAIADRIDAEYQKAEDEWKAKDGQTWLRGYGECHAEMMEGNEVIAADLERNGWVRLPKDTDGEYIHLGDVMEWTSGETLDVIGIGGDTLFYINDDSMVVEWTKASNKRHHKQTVKDVLRHVVTLCHNAWKEGSAFEFYDVDDVMNSGNIAYFAAKLQMKEG